MGPTLPAYDPPDLYAVNPVFVGKSSVCNVPCSVSFPYFKDITLIELGGFNLSLAPSKCSVPYGIVDVLCLGSPFQVCPVVVRGIPVQMSAHLSLLRRSVISLTNNPVDVTPVFPA